MALKRLFITGGNGMVGQSLLRHPQANAWEINAPSSSELDLRDAAAVDAYLRDIAPDVVVHCAGLVGGIQANIARPADFLLCNMQMGMNVIAAARDAGVSRLLNLGSSCIYPKQSLNPLCEDAILSGLLEPTNEGYALAKIAALRFCDYIRREDPSLNYKTIIPCNLYGPHDKFDAASAHMIPDVIRKMHAAKLSEATEIDIWNNGEARREFMYVGDLADAIYRHINSDDAPDVMNIGLGHDYSILDYYRAIQEVVGWDGEFRHDMSKPVGMQQKLVDIRRQTAWGWQSQTSLTDGLRYTYAFFLKQGGYE